MKNLIIILLLLASTTSFAKDIYYFKGRSEAFSYYVTQNADTFEVVKIKNSFLAKPHFKVLELEILSPENNYAGRIFRIDKSRQILIEKKENLKIKLRKRKSDFKEIYITSLLYSLKDSLSAELEKMGYTLSNRNSPIQFEPDILMDFSIVDISKTRFYLDLSNEFYRKGISSSLISKKISDSNEIIGEYFSFRSFNGIIVCKKINPEIFIIKSYDANELKVSTDTLYQDINSKYYEGSGVRLTSSSKSSVELVIDKHTYYLHKEFNVEFPDLNLRFLSKEYFNID